MLNIGSSEILVVIFLCILMFKPTELKILIYTLKKTLIKTHIYIKEIKGTIFKTTN